MRMLGAFSCIWVTLGHDGFVSPCPLDADAGSQGVGQIDPFDRFRRALPEPSPRGLGVRGGDRGLERELRETR
jgi:hypothetical protein